MYVELLSVTPSPEDLICRAYGTCTNRTVPKENIQKWIKAGHLSPLEHASASFLVSGISRACLAQLTRHRHCSFSVQSMRYNRVAFPLKKSVVIIPKIPVGTGTKRHGHCIFDVNQEQFIADLYTSGFSIIQMAEEYNIHKNTLLGIIRKHAQIRTREESKRLHIDTDYFSEIDSPIKAYILGLIYADGNVTFGDGVPINGCISQSKAGESWLNRLGKRFGGYIACGGRKDAIKLCIPSILQLEDLVKYGVVQAKSNIITFPQIKDCFVFPFLFGYFDGDGCISKDRRVSFCSGSEQFIDWVKNWLGEKGVFVSKYNNGGAFVLYVHKKSRDTFIEEMYNGYDFRLCNPKKLQRAMCISEKIRKEYLEQVGAWARTFNVVVPTTITNDCEGLSGFVSLVEDQAQQYVNLLALGIPKEDARFCLPLATTTKLIMTANFRQLRHVIELRCAKGAQWEIRELAMEILHRLDIEAPTVFYDLTQKFYNRKGE